MFFVPRKSNATPGVALPPFVRKYKVQSTKYHSTYALRGAQTRVHMRSTMFISRAVLFFSLSLAGFASQGRRFQQIGAALSARLRQRAPALQCAGLGSRAFFWDKAFLRVEQNTP